MGLRLRVGAVALASTMAACGPPPEDDPDLLWEDARPFADAVSDYGARGADWAEARAQVSIPDEFLARLEALPGRWRFLVVVEPWCIDSRESVPWLDGLADALPRVELRMVDSRVGGALLDRIRTPDDRGATPTLLLLAEDGSEAGCWVERPAPVQEWWAGGGQELDQGARLEAKADWWRRDRGHHLLTEVAEIMEAAASGSPICGRAPRSREALPEPGWPSPAPLTEGTP